MPHVDDDEPDSAFSNNKFRLYSISSHDRKVLRGGASLNLTERRPFLGLAACLVILLLLTNLCPPAEAQKDMGSIVGTVKDTSGAVVPEAKITVTEVSKGTSFNTSTGPSGDYVASPLPVGEYTVKVQKQGFKSLVVGPMQLDVQQRLSANATLEVGEIVQVVQVRQSAPLLETQTSDLGQVVGSHDMQNLPLNGRNFAQLALLSAGVVPSEPGSRNADTYGFSSNGGRGYENNFLLDGIDNNSNLTDLLNETSYVIQPSVDALQEFKVQTNAYSAEFGRGNGAVVNATIKSGSNQLHGDVYEFLRNDHLDGRNFFDADRAPYQQNQFGFTIGGPVYLGHLYDGRNRSFFFFDYEGLRIRQGETFVATVPTAVQRNGDFSDLLDLTSPTGVSDCNGTPTYAGEIFNTRLSQVNNTSPTGVCGVPFGYDGSGNPTNVIPQGTIDSLAARLTSLWPMPNVAGAGFNYLTNPKRVENRNNFDTRIDQKLSDKDNSFFRLSYEKQPSIIPSVFQSVGGNGNDFFSGDELNFYLGVALSESHIFSPRLVNEFRFGYNRINSHRYQFNSGTDVSASLGIPGVPFVPLNGGMPEFDFSDVDGIGDPTYLPSLEIQNTFSYADNLTWVRDKHTLKFGTEIRSEEFTILQPASPRGQLNFDPIFTDNAASPGSGGSGYASFLLGLPDGGNITNIHNVDYVRPVYAFYAQDDYRLTNQFTLNLGLRYELFMPVREKYDAQGSYDLTTRTLLVPKGQTAQLTPTIAALVPIRATANRGLVPADTNNFAPRIGFAYQATKDLVLRGAYGVFYSGYESGPWSNPSPAFNPPFFVTEVYNTTCGAASANTAAGQLDCSIPGFNQFSNGFPATSLVDPNTPQLLQLDPTIVTPYMQQWNLSTQYLLPADIMFQVSYAGSKGTKLYTFYNGNQAAPTSDPTIPYADRRPISFIDNSITNFASNGLSTYHSLQARVEKRFSKSFSFLASYTWSHSLDNASSANLGSDNHSGDRYFAMHPDWEHGNSDFDVRNRFVASYIYDLPFGQGRHFGSQASGALEQIIGGWRIAGITTLAAGNWYTVRDGNGNFSNSDGSQHPNLIENPNASPCVPGTFFNTCAFGDPPLGSFGNVGRNTIVGPGLNSWDFSIFKNFQISERVRAEFRSEFFNFPNHTNFTLPSGGSESMGSSNFGFMTGARPPRQIQFAMKFYF
jgi:Carboxypeptidase regulatory-like domain/TonB dependent receptor-like, beta-barrel